MDHEASLRKTRRRYAMMHLGVMGTLFASAALGAFLVPVEPGWRVGYAVAATLVVGLGILLSHWWALRQTRRLSQRVDESEEGPERS